MMLGASINISVCGKIATVKMDLYLNLIVGNKILPIQYSISFRYKNHIHCDNI